MADDGQTFRARCDEVAARYKLTPRESEVLRLLAKGRNAEHIARVLVLSIATVKSHIEPDVVGHAAHGVALDRVQSKLIAVYAGGVDGRDNLVS